LERPAIPLMQQLAAGEPVIFGALGTLFLERFSLLFL
jgi:hypothetical protein